MSFRRSVALHMFAATVVGGFVLGRPSASPVLGAPRRAERVVAIGGVVTEIIYALGAQSRLVARDSTSTFPPEARRLPDVGYMRALSPEGVLSVNPDLILARENSGPPDAIDVLKSARVPWVDVPDNFTAQGIDDNVRIIAAALGLEDEGTKLREKISAEMADAKKHVLRIKRPKRVLFILSLRDGRVLASGTNTAADGIIRLAGGVNVISRLEGYKPIGDEAIMTARPEVILMMDRHRGQLDPNAAERLRHHPALATTPAVKSGRIVRMDGLYLLGFGPRTAEAVRELAAAIHGGDLD